MKAIINFIKVSIYLPNSSGFNFVPYFKMDLIVTGFFGLGDKSEFEFEFELSLFEMSVTSSTD